MGNVNEKNTLYDDEMDSSKVTLDPRGHFDPWTNKREARAIEALLFPGIDPRYPPSPTSQPAPLFDQTISMLLPDPKDGLPEHINITQTQPSGSVKRDENKETGDTLLPLSGSIVPETYEHVEEQAPPAPGATLLATVTEIPTPTVHENHILLKPIGAAKESCPLPIVRIHPHPSSPVQENTQEEMYLSPTFQHLSPLLQFDQGKDNSTIPCLPADSVDANPQPATPRCRSPRVSIGRTLIEEFPSPSASNKPHMAPPQNRDLPVVPVSSPLSHPNRGDQPRNAPDLSPFILGPAVLDAVDELEAKLLQVVIAEREPTIARETSETMHPPKVLQWLRTSLGEDGSRRTSSSLHKPSFLSGKNSLVVPYTPHLKTIPSPVFLTEENPEHPITDLPADETPELGWAMKEPASVIGAHPLTSSHSPTLQVDTPGIANLVAEDPPTLRCASGVPAAGVQAPSVRPSEPSTERIEPHRQTALLAHLHIGIQSQPGCPKAQCVGAGKDRPMIVAEPESQTSIPSKLVIKTYADATNIAMQHPEIAGAVLQQPLNTGQTLSVAARYTGDNEGIEHTPDGPNWAIAPSEDVSRALSTSTPWVEIPDSNRRSASKPNWAEAPVPEPQSIQRIGKYQSERPRRRVKKGRRGDNMSLRSLQPVAASAQSNSANMKAAVEQCIPLFQCDPATEKREVSDNRQKVSDWMNNSVAFMRSPKSSAERGSCPIPAAPSSSFLMNSVSEVEELANWEKEFSFPSTREANTLAYRGTSQKEPDNQTSYDQGEPPEHSPSDQPSALPSEQHKRTPPASKNELESPLDKGKTSVRSSSPVRQERRASTASSIASGVSVSSRLFQRAIQEIGSRHHSAPDSYSGTLQFPIVQEELQTAIEANSRPPELLSGNAPLMEGTTPIAITVVTCPDVIVTQPVLGSPTPSMKGNVDTAAPPHGRLQPPKNSEKFMFSSQAPDSRHASNVTEGEKVRVVSQQTPRQIQLGGVRPRPELARGGKTPRATLAKTFIPQGKYVPPPIRCGQVNHACKAPTSAVSQVQKKLQASQLSTIASTNGRIFEPPGATSVESHFQPRAPASLNAQFGPFVPPSDPTGFSPQRRGLGLGTPTFPHVHADTMPSGFSSILGQGPATNDYMTNLALAQERLQQNMAELAGLADGHDNRETFNPAAAVANKLRNLNVRGQPSRVVSGVGLEDTRSYLQSPICSQGPPHTGDRANLPPRLQAPAHFSAHNMFEEYCKRQRQEIRTAYENMPSRLPRRKT